MRETCNRHNNECAKKLNMHEVYEGAIIQVFNREGIDQGKATLLRKCPSRVSADNLPYVMHELEDVSNKRDPENKKPRREKYSHIWASERWTVEWISHKYYRIGEKSCTEVNYYLRTSINFDSGYDINYTSKDNANKYIFIEEQGTLVTPSFEYPAHAVKALNKIFNVYGGELVMYANNQLTTRKKFLQHKVEPRIFSFLNYSDTFEGAIASYVEAVDTNDFVIVSGVTKINHPRTIRAYFMNKGLCLKKNGHSQKTA